MSSRRNAFSSSIVISVDMNSLNTSKATARKTPATKKPVAKKAPVRKAPTRKTAPTKKAPVKRKPVTKKAPAKKSATKKAPRQSATRKSDERTVREVLRGGKHVMTVSDIIASVIREDAKGIPVPMLKKFAVYIGHTGVTKMKKIELLCVIKRDKLYSKIGDYQSVVSMMVQRNDLMRRGQISW